MLKQVQYFQAVVRYGSFTKAAEECYISQSAISQQIQILEQKIGVKLLNRKKRKFSITPAGKYFYNRSLVWTADFEKMCKETVTIAHKDAPQICIGYLKCYSGKEFQQAVAEFAEKYPDVTIHIINGNHEELYDELRFGRVDIVLSDQRRAFSDEYVNTILLASECCIEIASRNAIAEMKSVEVQYLKDIPCILVASPNQRENEQSFYHDIVGIKGDFLFAENLEEARLWVIGGKGFMPVEGSGQAIQFDTTLCHVPLLRNGKPIKRNYCAFWKEDNSGYYVEEFASILKAKFSEKSVIK